MTAVATLAARIKAVQIVATLVGDDDMFGQDAGVLLHAICPHLHDRQLPGVVESLRSHELAMRQAEFEADEAVSEGERARRQTVANDAKVRLEDVITRLCVLEDTVTDTTTGGTA